MSFLAVSFTIGPARKEGFAPVAFNVTPIEKPFSAAPGIAVLGQGGAQ